MFAHLMYAQSAALFYLFAVTLSAARPGVTKPDQAQLDVYLKGDAGGLSATLPPAAFTAMTEELDSLLQPASVHVVMHGGESTTLTQDADYLRQVVVQVDFRGTCLPAAADRHEPKREPWIRSAIPLASTNVANGQVLPFSWVDCSAVNRFVGPGLAKLSDSDRAHAYGRALARLLAHEFYHVLTHSESHQETGVAKPRFSAEELLANHFVFDAAAISKLLPQPTALESVELDSVPVGGR